MRTKLIGLVIASLIVALPVAAKTHFNSKQKLITDVAASPQYRNLVMADMNGDGLKELVGYT